MCKFFFVVSAGIWGLVSTACGTNGLLEVWVDGGDPVDAAQPIDPYESDSDTSVDSESDGPPSGVGLCDDYPEPQGGFAVGDAVANFALHDRHGLVSWLCEWGGDAQSLMLLVLSSKW